MKRSRTRVVVRSTKKRSQSHRTKLPPFIVVSVGETVDDHNRNRNRSGRYAVFDVDNTLIVPKRGKVVPVDRNDWTFRFTSVQKRLQHLHRDGFSIVLRTDQSKEFRKDLVLDVAKALEIPVLVIIAFSKDLKKPDTSVFRNRINPINTNDSFYVGDAAGRQGDWSDVDKQFAYALNIRFYTPEEFFEDINRVDPISKDSLHNYTIPDDPVLIMIGIPGSGKSTLVQTQLKPKHYTVLSSDELGTSNPKTLLRIATDQWGQGQRRFVFDLTNLTEEHRARYRDWAHALGMTCRLVFMNTDLETALQYRDHQVPPFVIRKMFNTLQPPKDAEGCEFFTLIDRTSRNGNGNGNGNDNNTYNTFQPALLKKYADFPQLDPTGWIATQKYDGVRGLFVDGHLITRKHNIIHAPRVFMRWFRDIPKGVVLDGELYIPGKPVNKIAGLMNRDDPTDEDWKHVKFMLFDIVVSEQESEPYERRIPLLIKVVNELCGTLGLPTKDCPLEVVETIVVQSRSHLDRLLQEAVQRGEEGLVIRNPRAVYPHTRSSDILKVKPAYDDDEVVVIGYEKGTGKNANRLGALKVRWKDLGRGNATFKVGQGIGLTDQMRERYTQEFPIGSVITITFNGVYESGRPREPKFIAKRYDI